MTAGDRTPCLVPFCRRTSKRQGQDDEWICSKHWQAVPRRIKWLFRASRRKWQKTRNPYFFKMHLRIWEKCRAAACEALL